MEHETGFENESSSGYINRNVSRYMYETSHFHGKKPPCRIQFAVRQGHLNAKFLCRATNVVPSIDEYVNRLFR